MFAEIALHRRVPKQFDTFTYEIPQGFDLREGQFVRIPFRKQTLSGVVRRIHGEKPHYGIKRIAAAGPLSLTAHQMNLAGWMAAYYQCPFSKVIDLFVPEKVWPGGKKNVPPWRDPPLSGVIECRMLNVGETSAPDKGTRKNQPLKKIIQNLLAASTKKLLLEETPLPREEFYQNLIATLPKNAQALFLFPEVFHLKKFAHDLPVFHGALSEKQKEEIWHSVRQEKCRIIAGTRAALFLPFQKLSYIIIDFEHNESYHEKRAPYYDTLTVAEKLAELWEIPLIAISSTPRVETWYRSICKSYERYAWGKSQKKPTVSLIDMKNERRKGNYSLFGELTLQKIAASLSKNEQVLLFINRKGEASALLCRDCGVVVRCETCSSPLTVHKENVLHCHRCKKTKEIPTSCEKCRNVNLRKLGSGTEMVEKEIRKIFEKARVMRVEKTTGIDEKALQKADIIVATQIIDKPLALPRLSLSIAVMPDQLLQFPEFRAGERLFQLLKHIKNLTKETGEMIIQTFMPEQRLFQHLAKNRIEEFYKDELETRKSLSLPPFTASLNKE